VGVIVAVTPDLLSVAWPFIVRQLSRMPQVKPLHEIAADCYTCRLTPWVVVTDRPVAVVLMARDENGAACIWYAGGDDVDRWEAEVIALAFLWSQDNCDGSVYVEGRKGWQRRLLRYGFEKRGNALWAKVPTRPLR
jgi:hypothetical protein